MRKQQKELLQLIDVYRYPLTANGKDITDINANIHNIRLSKPRTGIYVRSIQIGDITVNIRSSFNGEKSLHDALFSIVTSRLKEMQ
ncbi:MAG: hypothetical protein LBR74_07090 [Eubacterium sp.]|jgi:hypothetical protein|nr:hypothetical protein [Eubacterium sp.]